MVVEKIAKKLVPTALVFLCGVSLAADQHHSYTLKDVFDGTYNAAYEGPALVGKLTLVLVEAGRSRQVHPNHTFRSGDMFRFEVSSNLDGWLYIFHRSKTGKSKQLWPQEDSAALSTSNNRILAKQTYVVPPRPGVFIFDDKIGEEHFYVAINAEANRPVLDYIPNNTSTNEAVDAGASQKPNTITRNYLIKDPFGGQGKGVTFDPGTAGSDSYIYFSAVPGDPRTRAMLEIRLRHSE